MERVGPKIADDALLTPEEILAAEDAQTIDVRMPEWPRPDGTLGYVRLRTLTNEQLVEYSEEIEGAAKKNANLLLIIKSAVKADGVTPLFTPKQLEALKRKSAKAFNRLAREALELNGVHLEAAAARGKNA